MRPLCLVISLLILCYPVGSSDKAQIAVIKPIVSADLANVSIAFPNLNIQVIKNTLFETSEIYLKNRFSSDKYEIIDQEQINTAIIDVGYFPDALALLDISSMREMANDLDADIIIAIDIEKFAVARFNRPSSLSFQTTIRCNAWSRINNRPYIIRVQKTGSDFRLPAFDPSDKPLRKVVADITLDCLKEIFSKIDF